MKILKTWLTCLAIVACIGACTPFGPVQVGDTEEQLIAARGQPTHRYPLPYGQLLEYNYGPYGQQTYMARLDRNGFVISFEQVLTDEKFARIEPGKMTKIDVLHLVGSPSQVVARMPFTGPEAWTYPYKEYDTWNFLMHVYFDASGVVSKLEKTPDLQFVGQPGNMFGAGPR
jgi:hypothetical protein